MSQENLIELSVEGMTCTNCAATVRRRLERDGLSDVNVNFASGEVSFMNPTTLTVDQIADHIDELGYHVLKKDQPEKKNY